MKTRTTAVVVLGLVLAAAPLQAGWFSRRKAEPTLPPNSTMAERMGRAEVHPTPAKSTNKADRHDAGKDNLRRFQRRPVGVTSSWVSALR